MMNTYRITFMTLCGKMNLVIQTADTLEEAKNKAYRHNILTHSPMKIVRTEVRGLDGRWTRI